MIRLALATDYPALCAYLETHWRKSHVFTTSPDLFRWQHWDAERERYNFAIAEEDGRILGVLGFVPHSQFDPTMEPGAAIWLCIWSVADETRGKGLGRKLLDWVEETYRPTFIGTNGASDMTMAMYAARGWKTGQLDHWYGDRSTLTVGRGGSCRGARQAPFKSKTFVENRYAKHPVYKYDIYGNEHTAIVVRVCEAPEIRMLRVVDVIGSTAGLCHLPWRQLIERYNANMLDFYCTGIPSRDLEACGLKRRRGDEVIVPNYFEPYEHRNVSINFAYKAPAWASVRVVKGDGDQDRPNIIAAAKAAA
jgi:GNAT superfamily N-acetyltransferase